MARYLNKVQVLSSSSLEVNFDIELQKMSYERQSYGGGNRRRRRGEANKSLNERPVSYNHNVEPDYDYHDRRQEVFETPEQKLRTAIVKLGEVVSLTDCFCSGILLTLV